MTKAAGIVALLGIAEYDINNPQKYNQIKSITDYFSQDPNPRYQILKILSKSHTQDKLEAVWTYVALQKEKQEKIKQLDPEQFEPDIEAELRRGVLTKEKRNRIKKDVDQKKIEKQKEARYQKEVDKAVSKIDLDLNYVESTLNQIDLIDKKLQHYA